MEHSSNNDRKNKNSILEKYIYNSNQGQKQNEFELISGKNSSYKIKNNENNENSNGSIPNKIYRLNNNIFISNYSKNNIFLV